MQKLLQDNHQEAPGFEGSTDEGRLPALLAALACYLAGPGGMLNGAELDPKGTTPASHRKQNFKLPQFLLIS